MHFEAYFSFVGKPFGAVEGYVVPRRALWSFLVHSALWGALRRLLEICTTFLDIIEHGTPWNMVDFF